MSSPFLNTGSDGRDPGANVARVLAQTAVALSGDRRGQTPRLNLTGFYNLDGISAELPREYLDTTYPSAFTSTVNVAGGGNLQAALNAATPGTRIIVTAGTSWNEIVIPLKTGDARPGGNGIITVVSSALASLPEGLRVLKSRDAANLVRIQTVTNGVPALDIPGGTQGWRFVGFDFGAALSCTLTGRIVRIGDSISSNALAQPNNIVFDRCWVDGHSTLETKRGYEYGGRAVAWIDCGWGIDVHNSDDDCQGIGGWSATGPVKIQNCNPIGSAENIMFGGSDCFLSGIVDVDIQDVLLEKPLSWLETDPSFVRSYRYDPAISPPTRQSLGLWDIKNLFEIKKARRVLARGCVLRNIWSAAQTGSAFLVKDVVYADDVIAGHTSDVTILDTQITNAPEMFVTSHSPDGGGTSQPVARIIIENMYARKIATNIGPYFFGHFEGTNGIAVRHVTVVGNDDANALAAIDWIDKWSVKDSIFGPNGYGVKGDGQGTGKTTFDAYCTNLTFTKNLLVGQDGSLYPAGNQAPATMAAVGFTNIATQDYSLLGTTQGATDALAGVSGTQTPPSGGGSPPPPTPPPASVASSLRLRTPPSASTSGVELTVQPVVDVLDQYGAVMLSYVGSIVASLTPSTGTQVHNATAGVSGGSAPWGALIAVVPSTGSYIWTFTAGALTVSAPAVTISLIAPPPAPPPTRVAAAIVLVNAPSTATSGVATSPQPSGRIVDQFGDPIDVSGAVITATVTAGTGTLPGQVSAIVSGGLFAFSSFIVATPSSGTPTIALTSPGLTGVSFPVAVVVPVPISVGVATQLVLTRKPSGAVSGRPFNVEPRLEWRDANGKLVTTETAPVTVRLIASPKGVPPNAKLIGTATRAPVGGVIDYTGSGLGVTGKLPIYLEFSGLPT